MHTLLVLPRYAPKGAWEGRFPYAHVVWAGEPIGNEMITSVLAHEDVDTTDRWFRIDVQKNVMPGGHLYRLTREHF